MNLFGVGPLEIVFLVIIALIVLGPKDMVKAGKTIGRVLRQLVMSENWRTIQQASKEIRNLPTILMREAGLDELQKDLPSANVIRKELGIDDMKKEIESAEKDLSDWTTPPNIAPPREFNKITPPVSLPIEPPPAPVDGAETQDSKPESEQPHE
jgi:Sec-independent protein translocase protein TatA